MLSRGYGWVAAIVALCLLPAGSAQAAKKPPRADLSVSSVTNPPTTATPGASFAVTGVTRNKGRARARGSLTRFFLSADSKVNRGDLRLGEQRVPALRRGRKSSKVTRLKIPSFVSAGTYRILACADRLGKVRESSERNNCKATRGRVRVVRAAVGTPGTGTGPGTAPAPALGIAPSEQAFAAAVGVSHGPITFTVTNSGKAASGALVTDVTGADAAMFKVSSDTCAGKSLAIGTSCTLNVTFTPTSLGAKTATLQVSGAPGGAASATLKGTGQTAAALGISPTTETFPSTAAGSTSPATTFTVTNNGQAVSGTLAATLAGTNPSQFKIAQDNCGGTTLAGGASCTVLVTFSPSSPGGKGASLDVAATPGGTATSALSGTGLTPASVSVSPPSQNFGTSSSGSQGSTFSFTVTNSGQETSGPIATTVIGDQASQFVISNNACAGATLNEANPTCTLDVTFMPTGGPGARQASLQVSASPGTPSGSPATSLLAGNAGSPALTVNPPSQNFGAIGVGTSSTFQFTVSNTSAVSATGPLTTTITGADASQFAISGTNSCAGATLQPENPGTTDQCTLSVTFSPGSAGPKNATLQVSGAPGGSATSSLSGTGVPPNPAALSMTPESQFFGSVPRGGSSGTFTFTVTNTGQSPSTAIAVSKTGAHQAQFIIGMNTCQNATLAPSATCTINVTFAPPTGGGTGARSATLQVTATQGGTDTSALTGTAT